MILTESVIEPWTDSFLRQKEDFLADYLVILRNFFEGISSLSKSEKLRNLSNRKLFVRGIFGTIRLYLPFLIQTVRSGDHMKTLILASSSPRRKELLENLQIPFEVLSSNVDESYNPELTPEEIVKELALRKAKNVAEKRPSDYVIGSDTVVVSDGKVLGKPENQEHAVQMLKSLSGRTHSVYTGVSIFTPNEHIEFYEKTDVMFWELTDDEINGYVATGEPFDKAGAYGIQGFGSMLVKKINGDYFSVVGLPLSKTVRALKKLGFKTPY